MTQEQELSDIHVQEELLAGDSLQVDKDDKTKHKLIDEIPETLHLSQSVPTQPSPKCKENPTDFQLPLKESHDHKIPVKEHGLASLARLIGAGDKEAAENSGHLLDVFKTNLHNPDSYVYLPAIRGLVMLVTKQLLRALTIIYYSVSHV